MEKDTMIKELIYMIDVAMDVMRDNWDAEYNLDDVIGNAQVILDTARTLQYYKDCHSTIKKTEDKRLFKFDYNAEIYSGELTKYFTFDEITEDQGFDKEDREYADELGLHEFKVIDNGSIIMTRIR